MPVVGAVHPIKDGAVPLHWAAFKGNTEIATLLLEAGAKVEEQSSANGAAIHLAADQGHFAMVELLLAHGADPNVLKTSGRGASPLLKSVVAGHLDVAELLVNRGADPNLGSSQRTPLHLAVEAGRVDLVKFLLAKGADVNKGAFNNWTPLHVAAERGHADLAELLIAAGANINATNEVAVAAFAGTPLDVAVNLGNNNVAEILRQHGATE